MRLRLAARIGRDCSNTFTHKRNAAACHTTQQLTKSRERQEKDKKEKVVLADAREGFLRQLHTVELRWINT